MSEFDAIIVGGGPAGLSAARALREAGVERIVVLEREREAGGVPRHCHHPGFGFSQFHWPYLGPAYARRLRREADGVEVRTDTSVIRIERGGRVAVATPRGLDRLSGRTVLLATGIREAPRAARLVSGERPWGVLTTGALQQLVHLSGVRPCRRALIVGTEWVSFSALLTLRRAAIDAVAMVEAGERVTALRAAELVTRYLLRVPVLTSTRVARLLGHEVLEGVEIERDGRRRVLACDAVIFTGRFVPEGSLLRDSHLEIDGHTGGPAIDQYWRCSDPAYFAAGNLLRAVESSGVVGREGAAAGRAMAAALAGRLAPPERRIPISVRAPLRYVYPQCIALPGEPPTGLMPRGRVLRAASGTLVLVRNGEQIWRRKISALPERRIRFPGRCIELAGLRSLEVHLQESPEGRRRLVPPSDDIDARDGIAGRARTEQGSGAWMEPRS